MADLTFTLACPNDTISPDALYLVISSSQGTETIVIASWDCQQGKFVLNFGLIELFPVGCGSDTNPICTNATACITLNPDLLAGCSP